MIDVLVGSWWHPTDGNLEPSGDDSVLSDPEYSIAAIVAQNDASRGGEMRSSWLAAFAAISLSGCATWFDGVGYDSKAGLAVVSNSERNFVVDYGGGEKGDRLRRCLEAPGPAALLNDFRLDTSASASGGKVTDAKVEADLKNTQSVAKLYEVSSILQYAHAMAYRICEATLNGFITPAEYASRFDALAATTTRLIELQLQLAREETRKAEADVEKTRLMR